MSTVVARKTAIVRAGGFDESLARCDDYDMWLRTSFYGGKVGYNRQVQARLYLGRPGSLGVSPARMAEAIWLILEKLQKLPLTSAQRKWFGTEPPGFVRGTCWKMERTIFPREILPRLVNGSPKRTITSARRN